MEQDLLIRVCLEELGHVLMTAVQSIPRDQTIIDHLSSSGDSFNARMSAVLAGRKSRVDYKRLLNRRVLRLLEGFELVLDTGDSQHYRLHLDACADLVLVFARIHHWGLGKAFEVKFRVQAEVAGLERPLSSERNLFPILGKVADPCFTYFEKDDLENLLDRIAAFLLQAIPVLRRLIERDFSSTPITLPPGIPVNGPLDTLAAFDKVTTDYSIDGKSRFIGGIRSGGFIELRERHGQMISNGGRINPHGAWDLLLLSPGERVFKWITLGHYGHYDETQFPWRDEEQARALERAWVHSTKDFEVAMDNGGRSFVASLKDIWDVFYDIQYEPERYRCDYPLARVTFSGRDYEGGRHDRIFKVNARDQQFTGIWL